MFWLLATFALIFQLPTSYSSLVCIACTQQLNPSSLDVINTTNCSQNSNPSPLCTAILQIDSASTSASVEFKGDPYNFTNLLNGKNIIKHNMEIGLNNNTFQRKFQISCFNNNSCSEDMKKIYDKSKKLNYTVLQNDLKNQLYNISFPVDNLVCVNNEDQQIPCPNGCCELTSNGKSGFNRKCIEGPCGNDLKVMVEQNVVGKTDAESIFTYRCNKPTCNDMSNAKKVHDLLKDNWLLTPTGVGPDPPNTAMTLVSKTSTVIQYILMVTIISYFKYN